MQKSGLKDDKKKAVIWREWENGTPMAVISRAIEKPPATVYSYLLYHGGMSNASFYKWRSKFGGMDASLISRMKMLEEENRRLKKMDAEKSMQADFLKEVLGKKW